MAGKPPQGGKRGRPSAQGSRPRMATLSKDLVAIANPKKSGYLTIKKGGPPGSYYFILGDDTLFYFNSELEQESKGAFPLSVWDRTSPENELKCTFELIHRDGSKVRLQTDSKESMASWVTKIQEAQISRSDSALYGQGRARKEYSLFVKIWEAKDLAFSDTFASVAVGNAEIGRSAVIWQNSSPYWHFESHTTVDKSMTEARVQVNAYRKNKIVNAGYMSIPITDNMSDAPQWYPLIAKQSTNEPIGSLHLKLSREDGKICAIVEKVDLPPNATKGNTYAVAMYSGKKDVLSEANSSSSWKEDNKIYLDTSSNEGLKIEYICNGECIGQLNLPPEKLKDDAILSQTSWNLSPPERGQIRLSIKRTSITVLDDNNYDDLFALLIENNLDLVKIMASVQELDSAYISECLLKVFERRGMASTLVRTLISDQIQQTNDPNIIFRSNTLATKTFDAYMNFVALPHLHKLLKPIITEIFKGKKPCELDYKRLDDVGKLKKHQQNLNAFSEDLFKEVLESINYLPMALRNQFQNMRAKLKEKWPDDKTVIYTGPSGFFFLRFLCPAILSPMKFGLASDHPSAEVARDLTLLGKVIQTLANLTSFGKKENYMISMNEFIDAHKAELKRFIDELCERPNRPIDDIPSSHADINFGKEMAKLVTYIDDRFASIVKAVPAGHAGIKRLRTILDELNKKAQEQEAKSVAPLEKTPAPQINRSEKSSDKITGSPTSPSATSDASSDRERATEIEKRESKTEWGVVPRQLQSQDPKRGELGKARSTVIGAHEVVQEKTVEEKLTEAVLYLQRSVQAMLIKEESLQAKINALEMEHEDYRRTIQILNAQVIALQAQVAKYQNEKTSSK